MTWIANARSVPGWDYEVDAALLARTICGVAAVRARVVIARLAGATA